MVPPARGLAMLCSFPMSLAPMRSQKSCGLSRQGAKGRNPFPKKAPAHKWGLSHFPLCYPSPVTLESLPASNGLTSCNSSSHRKRGDLR